MMTYKQHRYTSRYRRLEFKLTEQDFARITSEPCFYCGSPAGGIDRQDPKKGYLLDNCVSACKRCNARKSIYESLGVEESIKKTKELAHKNKIPPQSKREWRMYGPWKYV